MADDSTLGPWFGFEVIHSYTRAQALADGVLVDVTEIAKTCGYQTHTAFSEALFEHCERVARQRTGDPAEQQQETQRVARRVLAAARSACLARAEQDNPRTYFQLPEMTFGEHTDPMILHIGGGDNGEPVATVMYPEDD